MSAFGRTQTSHNPLIMNPTTLTKAAQYIQQSDAIIIAAGAGMGVDSGLPDFRGNEGFWKAYPALAQARLDSSEIASPATFERDIKLAWGFYGHRLALYRNTIPHQGFEILKRWGESAPRGYSIFTSNVDGQFQKAGFDQNRIYECHGSIHHLQCLEPCVEDIWSADAFSPQINAEKCLLTNTPPRCRPLVVDKPPTGYISEKTAPDYKNLTQMSDTRVNQAELWLTTKYHQ